MAAVEKNITNRNDSRKKLIKSALHAKTHSKTTYNNTVLLYVHSIEIQIIKILLNWTQFDVKTIKTKPIKCGLKPE